MRGDLVAAMLHSPSVLFLDEPTIGLDVEAKHDIRNFIKELNAMKKTTIILTTHDMEDIKELCTRIVIINRGVIIEDGSLTELIDRLSPYRYLIVYFYEKLHIPHPKAEIVSTTGTQTKYSFREEDISVAKLIEDISFHAQIKDISIEDTHIDDIIREVYQADSTR